MGIVHEPFGVNASKRSIVNLESSAATFNIWSGDLVNSESYQNWSEDWADDVNKKYNGINTSIDLFDIRGPADAFKWATETVIEFAPQLALIYAGGKAGAIGGAVVAGPAGGVVGGITGSIGVFGMLPNFTQAANKLGLNVEQVKTNVNAAGYTPFLPLDDNFRGFAQEGVEKIYTTFVNRVAAGRRMSFEQVDAIGQGDTIDSIEIHDSTDALFAAQADRIKDWNASS